jgi:hypothetical protein
MCAEHRRAQRGRPKQPAPGTLPDDLYDYDDDPAPRISPPRGSPSHVFDEMFGSLDLPEGFRMLSKYDNEKP